MNIKILKKKPTITINEEDYLDLSANSFNTDILVDFYLGFEIVDEFGEMRPDLIALKWYGTTENLDILLKVNNIFNPFSIKEGDLLVIPAIKGDTEIYKQQGSVKKFELRNKFSDVTRMSANDIARLKALVAKNKDKKNKLKQPLPPNMLSEGVSNKKFEQGSIILTNHHGTNNELKIDNNINSK